MGVMRRGVRGFPCRVTPSHFGLDSRGRYDRLAVPGLLFFKLAWCSKNIMLPGSCCQVRNCVGASFIFWSCVIAFQGYFDSSASFFLLPFEGLGVTLICPCSEWFQTFSGKVSDELVWELGQTCASCSEWYHNNLQLNNHGGKNSKSTYSNGWILCQF